MQRMYGCHHRTGSGENLWTMGSGKGICDSGGVYKESGTGHYSGGNFRGEMSEIIRIFS